MKTIQDSSQLPFGRCDLGIVVTPAFSVPSIIEQLGAKGVSAAIVISAGFKEIGLEGSNLEDDVMIAAKRYGVRIVGPNTLGVISGNLNASFAVVMPPKGSISFMSQSGALCTAILDLAESKGLG